MLIVIIRCRAMRQIWTQVFSVLSGLAVLSLTAPRAEATLYIGNTRGDSILLFDEVSQTFGGNFITPGLGGLSAPDAITLGPDGNFYVSSGGSNSLGLLDPAYPTNSAILRYSPTGSFLGVAASGNGLSRPYGHAFGPDGKLYVSSFRTNQILRFDAHTGNFLDVFASDNNGGLGSLNGLNGPNQLLFGPDGSLYVTTEGTVNDATGNLAFLYASQVLRYSADQVLGHSMAPQTAPQVLIDQPALLPESPGFISLLGIIFDPNYNLLVSDFAGGIRRYDPSGNLLDVISTNYTTTNTTSGNFIGGLTFGADNPNTLYAVGFNATTLQGSLLAFAGGQGSETSFSGTLFSDEMLRRPIGILAQESAAVPEPTTVAGLALAGGSLLAARRRAKRISG
jgi:hypothetical protein